MRINKIGKISNYRQLGGLEITFNKNTNFIVGENNVGKTSVLEMINSIFESSGFKEEDFQCIDNEISLELEIGFEDYEEGFYNYFDIEGDNSILLKIRQEHPDSKLEFFARNGNELNSRELRKLSVFFYSSNEMKINSNILSKNHSKSRVLKHIFDNTASARELLVEDVLDEQKINEIETEMSEMIGKINIVAEDDIAVYRDENINDIILSLLKIGKNHTPLERVGDGVEAVFNISLSILNKLVFLKETRQEEFVSYLVENTKGEKLFPIILLIDEPENHQHPFRQRCIVKGIEDILSNQDSDFLYVLKKLFDIDGIVGQVNYVTHSPYILSDNYTQFVRLFDMNGEVNAVCGEDVVLPKRERKNMFHHFLEMKEAFFARKVVLVEGPTDAGVVRESFNHEKYNADKHMLTIISLNGVDTILSIIELFKAFNIEVVAYIDGDSKKSYEAHSANYNIKFTETDDIEEEVYKYSCFDKFIEYFRTLDDKYKKCFIKHFKKLDSFDIDGYKHDNMAYLTCLSSNEKDECYALIKEDLLKIWAENKNYIHGILLAEMLVETPPSIMEVIGWCKND